MAKVASVNNMPTNGGEAMFMLLEFLRDQMGFTITISGDGIAAFDGAGASVITHGGSGANGMANTNAHFTAEDPSGVYGWCFQENTLVSWEVVSSALDGFTGGSATVRPTATDEQVLLNTTLFTTANTYRWHMTGDTAAIGATVGVYPWRAWSSKIGIGGPFTLLGHEPLKPGSYPELVGTRAVPTTGEPDPCVYMAIGDPQCCQFSVSSGGWSPSVTLAAAAFVPAQGYYCMNGVNGNSEQFTRFMGSLYMQGTLSTTATILAPAGPYMLTSGGSGVDPRDGKDTSYEFSLARPVASGVTFPGPKGIPATLRQRAVLREYPAVMDIAGERYVYMNDLLIPFANGELPL